MTIFSDLCNIATDDQITPEVAAIVDKAIKETEQGNLCISLIYQYNSGLITFAEFRNSFIFIAAALQSDN